MFYAHSKKKKKKKKKKIKGQKLYESGGGRAGIPVPNNPDGLVWTESDRRRRKTRRRKEEEAAAAGHEEVKFTVMIMDTVETISPINIFHSHDHGHCRHSFTY